MKKHEAYFTYHNKKIPFSFWVHPRETHPDTVIFLGTGQIKRIPYWVAKAAPAGVVVAEGLPHWHSNPSAEDIASFTQEYTTCVLETILGLYGQDKVNLIAQSQAAPGVLSVANGLKEKVGNIALLLPMGLNTNHLGSTDEERYKELKRRTIKSLLHPEQRGPKNVYAGTLLAKIILNGLKDGSTKAKYSKGLSFNALPDLARVLKRGKHAVSIFLGEDDILFPASEIQQSLTEAGITNISIKVMPKKSHTSLTTKQSIQMVTQAVRAVRRS